MPMAQWWIDAQTMDEHIETISIVGAIWRGWGSSIPTGKLIAVP